MARQRISCFTLVDITPTGVRRVNQANTIEYHQQQNLNMILQTVAMKTQPLDYRIEIFESSELAKHEFGDKYTEERVWNLIFDVDHEDVFADENDKLALLKRALDGVAFTSDLNETAEFDVCVYSEENIRFYII